MSEPLLIAKNDHTEIHLLPQMANRHGLITGATGTGKTVTLQVLAEHFSAIGVPCFMSDVKGDLSGISRAGGGNAKVDARVAQLGLDDFSHSGFPVTSGMSGVNRGIRFAPPFPTWARCCCRGC